MTSKKRRRSRVEMSVSLRIECRDGRTARALYDVLMPDNRYFPKDQDFVATKDGRAVSFEIGSPRVRPALSTATSLVSDAKLFHDLWVDVAGPSVPRLQRLSPLQE